MRQACRQLVSIFLGTEVYLKIAISLSLLTRSYEKLLEIDLKPFIELKNNLGALMTAHITFPKIDDICVSYSDIWIKKILKEKLTFEGIVFSDDLIYERCR